MQTTGFTGSRRQKAIAEARAALKRNHPRDAAGALKPILARHRDDAEVLFLQAAIAEQDMRFDEASRLVRKSLRKIERPESLFLLARAEQRRGLTEESLAALDKLPRGAVPRVVVESFRATTLEQAGRFDDAMAVIEPLVEEFAARGTPVPVRLGTIRAALLVQFKRLDEAIELIDDVLTRLDENAADNKRYLYQLRAKACDRAKRYADASESARRSNSFGRFEFDPELYESQVSVLIENWSAEQMAQFPLSGCDSELPVFVAGMPRSGTSLIDQIIDAHPQAAGVGELNSLERFAVELSKAYNPDALPARRFGRYDARAWTRAAKAYVAEITALAPPGAERVVNKALGNNKLVGLLARLFPKTRIIHAIRDPRDVAVSCFMGGFNNRVHPWTVEIDWVARAWEQSMRMMEHWKRTLDVPILDVHYEKLVADPEREMPRIIEFLGLEWDDACREFYKSKRTVRTLSYDQVNRPLYTSSAGRHANYAALLEGVSFPEYDPWADGPTSGSDRATSDEAGGAVQSSS